MHKTISVRGAREHNLKGVNVDLPRDRLVVITGLSGSGKSSLAFDTIYAEGQRRYVESLSAYARQFLELMQKPDVDTIEGLSPAISIEQKTTSRNPRSTVGTVTEIYDYMRLLFARVGVPYSPATGLPIESQTVSQMVDRILEMKDGTRLYLLAPIVRGRKGEYRKELEDLRKRGFQRVKVDGKLYEIDAVPALNKKLKHDIEVVVDRIVLKRDLGNRLADSLETALGLAEGLVFAENADTGERTAFSARFACPVSGFTIDEIEPRLFSFNNPYGACPACDGLGVKMFFDPELVVPNEKLSLEDGAVAPWANSSSQYYRQTLASLAKHFDVSMRTPWKDLPAAVKKAILHGTGESDVTMEYDDGLRRYKTIKPFEGVVPNMERRWKETDSAWVREEMQRFQNETTCEACAGHRLKPEALAVKIRGKHIGEVSELSIAEAAVWYGELNTHLKPKDQEIAQRILKEINERLGFLVNVGLEYLTLSRGSGTLSGGESQRIRLASQIGSGLTGVLYVLDEPSIGLHQRDNQRLLDTLKRLRDIGNTVIVVEHDEEAIRSADYLVDMGPGAGVHGGTVVASGTPDQVMAAPDSITAQYLTGFRQAARGGGGRAGEQPGERHRGVPARLLHLRDRRIGRRKILAGHRDALQGAGPPPARRARAGRPARPHPGRRAPRQDHRHRPVADRPHPPLEPRHLYRRLHADPRLVRRPARGKGAGLRAGALLVQRQGRALRGLPGRRRHQDRDALPARRLRAVRRLQGQALQPRDLGGAVQGQDDRRRAGPDRRGRR
jgi:excinuclease ABC subunit A